MTGFASTIFKWNNYIIMFSIVRHKYLITMKMKSCIKTTNTLLILESQLKHLEISEAQKGITGYRQSTSLSFPRLVRKRQRQMNDWFVERLRRCQRAGASSPGSVSALIVAPPLQQWQPYARMSPILFILAHAAFLVCNFKCKAHRVWTYSRRCKKLRVPASSLLMRLVGLFASFASGLLHSSFLVSCFFAFFCDGVI